MYEKSAILRTIKIFYRLISIILVFFIFVSVCLAIVAIQLLGILLYNYRQSWYHAIMKKTRGHAGIICIALAQWLSPSLMVLSGDKAILSHFGELSDKQNVEWHNRFIFISNHLIYIDWLYIWWIAYTKKIHDHVYIILKDSLRKIPIIGWGLETFGFIFLSRSWSKDCQKLNNSLEYLSSLKNEPMLLLLYPEGTNLSSNTKPRSLIYLKKNDLPILDYVLLPRIKGLYFCLTNLHESTKYLYDCTIAYEGVAHDTYPQDVFTLKSIFLGEKYPKSVHIHFRRFHIDQIPLDEEKFKDWLYKLWTEKEELMHQFVKTGSFSSDFSLKTKLKLISIMDVLRFWDVFIIIFFFIIFIYYFLNKLC